MLHFTHIQHPAILLAIQIRHCHSLGLRGYWIPAPSRFFTLEPTRARVWPSFPMSNWTFASTISFLQFLFETVPLWMKWTRKHKNLTSASDHSVFRSGRWKKNAATSHREQSRRAGETSQENQQLRLQRRRKQKRARVERETRDWTVWAKTSNTKTAKSRTKGNTGRGRVSRKPATSVFREDLSMFTHGLLLSFRGCESLSKKPINATKIGHIPRYTNTYQWIKYEGIFFSFLSFFFNSNSKHR